MDFFCGEDISMSFGDGSYSSPILVGALREGSCAVADVPADCWVECSTGVLMELMASGRRVTLPGVDLSDVGLRAMYSDEELAFADAFGDDLDIVSVEYVGEEEVQCIEVEDPDHMYVTDDFISTHNTSNIVFLKSTDDSMLDTLEKMSGKTHRTYAESKMITQDVGKVVLQNEDKRSITYTTKEEPVISYNQMAFLGERQSIVFRASDPPVLNKNQMILPMSWRLFLNKIVHPGHDYSLQTIPTLSSASEFDARKNLPQFEKMVNKRLAQACYAEEAVEAYKSAFGLDDYAVEQLDPDTYSEAVMEIIQTKLNVLNGRDPEAYSEDVDPAKTLGSADTVATTNEEGISEMKAAAQRADELSRRIYAGATISRNDLAQYNEGGTILHVNHALDDAIVEIYKESQSDFARDSRHFSVVSGSLYDASRRNCYIQAKDRCEPGTVKVMENSHVDMDSKTFEAKAQLRQDTREGDYRSYVVTDAFYKFLLSLGSWKAIAGGALERGLMKALTDVD